jgi:hypothetical protein
MSGAPTRGEKTAEGEVSNCPRRGELTLTLGVILVNIRHYGAACADKARRAAVLRRSMTAFDSPA